MKELFVARHAESELNLENVLNGDPALAVGLTPLGEVQARALGAAVGQVDLAVHTRFQRTRGTAELAWPGAPLLEVPELDEIRFGRWEGTRFGDGYEGWARSAGPEEASPGGGESRVEAARRFVRGYRVLLARPEERVAAIAHGAPVAYVLLALEGKPPVRRLAGVEQARPFAIAAEDLERALDLIDAWAAAPTFWAD